MTKRGYLLHPLITISKIWLNYIFLF